MWVMQNEDICFSKFPIGTENWLLFKQNVLCKSHIEYCDMKGSFLLLSAQSHSKTIGTRSIWQTDLPPGPQMLHKMKILVISGMSTWKYSYNRCDTIIVPLLSYCECFICAQQLNKRLLPFFCLDLTLFAPCFSVVPGFICPFCGLISGPRF